MDFPGRVKTGLDVELQAVPAQPGPRRHEGEQAMLVCLAQVRLERDAPPGGLPRSCSANDQAIEMDEGHRPGKHAASSSPSYQGSRVPDRNDC